MVGRLRGHPSQALQLDLRSRMMKDRMLSVRARREWEVRALEGRGCVLAASGASPGAAGGSLVSGGGGYASEWDHHGAWIKVLICSLCRIPQG